MLFRSALLLVSVIVLGCASGERPLRSNALLDEGERAFHESRWADAKVAFREAMRSEQDRFLALIGLARVAAVERNWREFDATMSIALERAPHSAEAYDLLGRTLLQSARRADAGRRRQAAKLAVAMFVQANRKEPARPLIEYHTGLGLHLSDDDEAALPFAEAAYRRTSDNSEVRAVLLEVLHRLRRPARIIEILAPIEKSNSLTQLEAAFLERARKPAVNAKVGDSLKE